MRVRSKISHYKIFEVFKNTLINRDFIPHQPLKEMMMKKQDYSDYSFHIVNAK